MHMIKSCRQDFMQKKAIKGVISALGNVLLGDELTDVPGESLQLPTLLPKNDDNNDDDDDLASSSSSVILYWAGPFDLTCAAASFNSLLFRMSSGI